MKRLTSLQCPAAFLLLAIFGQPCSASEPGRPNVLLILLDDLGFSDLGCYGGEIPTPNIDRLAAGGVRMSQFYNSARCCPSRASLMTGLHPHQTGIGSFSTERPDRRRGPAYLGHLNDRCVTLAEVLKTAGYQTYMVGKWHLELPGPIEHGFDEFYGYTRGYAQDQWSPDRYQRLPEGRRPERTYADGQFYATDVFTDYALEFLRQSRQKDAPWFLYLAHSSPHFPVQAPAESVERFVETYRRGWDVLREERFRRMNQIGLATDSWRLTERSLVPVDDQPIANGYGGRPNPAWQDLPADRREDLARRMAIFAAMVYHVDQGVGRIVADLESHNQLETTLILLLSDNGACYEWGPFGFDDDSRKGITHLHQGDELKTMGGPGTHHAYGSAWANLCNTPLRLYKHFTHEGGISSPMIAHWPKSIPPRKEWVRQPGHVMDVMPTLCEATGAEYPSDFQGRTIQPAEGVSLLPALRGEPLAERSLAFEHQEARALRKGRWKVVWSKRMPHEIQWELYDLENDRCETTDLAAKYPQRTAALADEWIAWAKRVKVYPFFTPEVEQAGEEPSPPIANRPLRVEPGVVFMDTAVSRPFKVGERVFRDREHRLKEWPNRLDGAILLQTNMEGAKHLRCIRPGAVYFLTPLPDRSDDSQSETLQRQGFAKAALPAVTLSEPGNPDSYCVLYEKECVKGETVEFGKWAVPVVFEETRTTPLDAKPATGSETVMVAGLAHPVPTVNLRPGPEYADSNRRFGIASSINRTPGGRLWCGFSSGGEGEGQDNFGVVVISDDDGLSWSEPLIVLDQDGPGGIRTDHVTVWTDPSGVLWIMWSEYPKDLRGPHSSLWAVTCANPDDPKPVWSAPRKLADQQNLLTTPTVLADGTWVFPTGNWQRDGNHSRPLISKDNGQTFELGGELTADKKPDFDEYMIVEKSDGRLVVFNRHAGSFLQCESKDQGRTWTKQQPNGLPHNAARFVFMKLRSGAWLLVKHGSIDQRVGRSHLTAFLSHDEGKTWQGGLVLDDRDCSYPFASESADGTIYVSYERQRWLQPEILFARFTEADVAAGKPVSERAALRRLVNKAGGVAKRPQSPPLKADKPIKTK